jgi:tRNA nucleotidyltransferase/poly(A) polymerase
MDKLLIGKNLVAALILLKKTGLLQVMLKDFGLRRQLQFSDMSLSNDPDMQWAKLMQKVISSRNLSVENLTKIAFHLKWSKKRRKKILTNEKNAGILNS